jgi:hypothetical protein
MSTPQQDAFVREVLGVDLAAYAPPPAADASGAAAAPAQFDPLPPLGPASTNPFIAHPELLGDMSVPRAKVEQELTEFLTGLQHDQGGRSVKLGDRVRLAGNALTKGLPCQRKMETMLMQLQQQGTSFVPAELAKKMAAELPDTIPAENFDALTQMSPKEVGKPEHLSVAGALAKVLSPTVHKALGFLPPDIRKAIEKAMEDAVAAGVAGLVDAALSNSQLDDQTKTAIENAVEAAIKLKQDDPPKRPPDPGAPAQQPPPSAAPPPAAAPPGEQIYKSPAVPIPDVPDDTAKKRDDAAYKKQQQDKADGKPPSG